jgi:hypothetical protein
MVLTRPVLYLMTGVLVSMLSQNIVNRRMFLYRAHVIPWVKFLSTFLVGLVSRWRREVRRGYDVASSMNDSPDSHDTCSNQREQTRSQRSMVRITHTRAQRFMMVSIGVLEMTAYILFCIGFGYCGADATAVILPSIGQILTAFFSVTILSKSLPKVKWFALLLVSLGIWSKSWDVERGNGLISFLASQHEESRQQFRRGLVCLSGAGLCYSLLGVMYEFLLHSGTKDHPEPAHADIMFNSSVIGSILSTLYQIVYVLPRWNELIGAPLASSGVSVLWAVGLLFIFGILYNVHTYAQGMVFKSDGALGMQIVNAVRGSITNVAASWVFCPSGSISSCVTIVSISSGILTACGGILWTLSTDLYGVREENKIKKE